MKKRNAFVKKLLFMACVSTMLVAGIPSGVFAEDVATGVAATSNTTVTSGAAVTSGTAAAKQDVKLTPAASDCMQKIYECLMKEDSDFMKSKKETEEITGGLYTYSASVSGSAITVTAEGKEDYASTGGSWDFVLEGDYLTYVPKEGDYMGETYLMYVIGAVADYLGMDGDLVSGYIAGLNVKNLTTPYYGRDMDAEGNTTKYKVYVGGAYDMKELDTFYLDEDTIGPYGALGEDYSSMVARMGKLMMGKEGKNTSVEIFIGEHGELTELTYKSIMEVVRILQPVGYEEFLENYKELSEVSTKTYQVSYVADASELPDSLKDQTHYKFVRLHFSAPALSAKALTMEAGGFDFLTAEDCEVKKWSSSNKKVAVVEDGQVTALKKGNATITATLTDGSKLTCKVKVASNPTMKIGGKAYKKNVTYTVKKKGTLKATIKGKALSADNSYKSSKKAVAKITSGKS